MTDTEINPETAAGGSDEQAWEEALIADLRANGGPALGRAAQGAPDHRHVLDQARRPVSAVARTSDLDRRRCGCRRGTAGGSNTRRPGWRTSKRIPTSSSSSATRRPAAEPRSTGTAPSATACRTRMSSWLPHFAAYPETDEPA